MRHLTAFARPYRLLMVCAPLLMIGEVTCDLLLPYLMSFIVNYGIIGMDVAAGPRLAAWLPALLFGPLWTRAQLMLSFGMLMLAATVAGGCFGVLCSLVTQKAVQGFGHDLRTAAFAKVMSLSLEQTDEFTTGSLVTRLTNDVTTVIDFLQMLLRSFVRPPMFMLGGMVMLFSLDRSFGCVVLFALPALGALLYLVLKRALPLFAEAQMWLDTLNLIVQENLGGARVIKAYVREDFACAQFGRVNDQLKAVNVCVLSIMASVPPLMKLVLNYAVLLVIFLGCRAIGLGGAMTTGAIMAAVTYTTQSIRSLIMASNLLQSVSRAHVSAARIEMLLGVVPAIADGGEPLAAASGAGNPAVVFDDVSFSYPDAPDQPVLSHISLTVRQGETFAVIGSTGCGKTTLVSLVPRFYDVTAGAVCVYGTDVRSLAQADVRGAVGFVMQKSELFSATVAENIRLGKADATDDEVWQAARDAQADGFVAAMDGGYGAFIAERGTSLSGGQKQRIALARALVRRPAILILDDATSALDLETESRLHAALRERYADTTIIMVAQRIASVKGADRIAVIENDGTCRHCAPHDELLRTSQTYREIYDSQVKTGALIEEEA